MMDEFEDGMDDGGMDDNSSSFDGAKSGVAISDLRLNERWGADDNDLRLIKALGRYFSGEAGSRAHAFPGFVKGTEPYRALVSRGMVGDGRKAKTLLAIIMELDKVERLSSAQYIGTLADNTDPGLEVIKTIIVPMLVEDLAIYAGWVGYILPDSVMYELDLAKKKSGIMNYTKNWILEQIAADVYMATYLEKIEDEALGDITGQVISLGDNK